jgi:hypothetical protein
MPEKCRFSPEWRFAERMGLRQPESAVSDGWSSLPGLRSSAWFHPGISIAASVGICGLLGAMIALGVRHSKG